MKTIIAGTRSITDYQMVCDAIEQSGFQITQVVSGGANGVDSLGEQWAREHGVPIKIFKPNWKDITVTGAIVKENKYGKYNAVAGHMRNEQMAIHAEALIAVWDGESRGTENMVNFAEQYLLRKYIYEAFD